MQWLTRGSAGTLMAESDDILPPTCAGNQGGPRAHWRSWEERLDRTPWTNRTSRPPRPPWASRTRTGCGICEYRLPWPPESGPAPHHSLLASHTDWHFWAVATQMLPPLGLPSGPMVDSPDVACAQLSRLCRTGRLASGCSGCGCASCPVVEPRATAGSRCPFRQTHCSGTVSPV